MNYSVIWKEKLEDMGATVKNRNVVLKSLRIKFPKSKFVPDFRAIHPENHLVAKFLRILGLN